MNAMNERLITHACGHSVSWLINVDPGLTKKVGRRSAVLLAGSQLQADLSPKTCPDCLGKPEHIMTWHVVTGQGDVILGVYGAALLSEAQELARRITSTTGLPTRVEQVNGSRPRVGDVYHRRIYL